MVPFIAEDALKAAGADYSKADPFTEHVVVDGRLITGQNPQSAHGVGQKAADLLQEALQ
jgi:putative intracellular protease/amidase